MTTDRLSTLLATAERLHLDTTFAEVRAWKERTGGLAVGFMPVYVPREILHAMSVLPVGILGAGDNLEIIKGDAYYQSYVCHIPRSTIELGLNGSLDCLDGFLFPATCDVIRNLSGMWMMQFPGKYAHYLDVPQDFAPEVGGAFYRHVCLSRLRRPSRRRVQMWRRSPPTPPVGIHGAATPAHGGNPAPCISGASSLLPTGARLLRASAPARASSPPG